MGNTVWSRIPAFPVAAALLVSAVACSDGPDPAPGGQAAAPEAVQAAVEDGAAAPDGAAPPPDGAAPTSVASVTELDWDSLIPENWRPETLMQEYDAEGLEDDDPRAQELMDRLKILWDQAPVVPELDGRAIRLPGFVVPVQSDGSQVSEFLLVPYYGACIHVPPPPANQTVYVVTEQGKGTRQELFDTVWVTGTLSVKHSSTDLAEAGYTLYASRVEPYEE